MLINIKKGQIYEHLRHGQRVEVIGKKGSKIKTRVLTAKPGVFGHTHTFVPEALLRKYRMIKKQKQFKIPDIHDVPDNSIYIGFVIEGKNNAKHIKLDVELFLEKSKGMLAHALDQITRLKKGLT